MVFLHPEQLNASRILQPNTDMSSKNEQGGMDVKQKNVFNAPLHKHSSESSAPKSLPSSLHAGYCTAANPIGAQLTSAFIRASGLKDVSAGQRFCVSAASWKKVADKGEDVPGVTLASSHVGALDSVGLDVLKKWEVRDHSHQHGAARAGDGNGFVRESGEIGGKEPRA
ncbi:hypothetical protein HBI56_031220 [Parastagonospora nodorum]|uniref:Uncharacterized protein n=2 Tax=Phaeosphaeria nodorum (strain SN15 / ATCC MYA-4574 / FGSC 10173) TaxID=321614 RepID=A0A7U2EYC8_PHANO|nr:hypothetical protein HBH56_018930 [Parastagonospora nodorum]QRC95305.1 hypothetical protein JI435_030080 [Parastagonospora nodorum SN15]KAH3936902.1 hypothetical protein HBH54_015560 [Parastagonospora nodorum]KAH3962724.1 hypothetical protein HBH51_174090 [Parastagonospora nodorum]KAH3990464.1 hypothetical protein HBH52_004470 [Parastagonospora nodorum]